MIQQPIPKPRKRRGRTALIDAEQVRSMAAQGASINALAKAFNCSPNAICGICADFGIPLIARAGRRGGDQRSGAVRQESQSPVAAPVVGREAELVATGGRYADLRAWAGRWGVTETKARQEWHKLRLPVGKRASA